MSPANPSETDLEFVRQAIEVSRKARERGDHPFGAIFVDAEGQVLMEGLNSVRTSGDLTGHAETNLARQLGPNLDPEVVAGGTLYSSCEPCAMCAGAMYWAGVNRLVYGMNESDLMPFDEGDHGENATMTGVGCRAVLASGQRDIEVIGPTLVDEAVAAHVGYWES